MNKAKQWFTGEVITADELNRIEGRITDADGKMYRPNLLINSDFRNPINQRGQTSYTGASSKIYTIDRWCMGTYASKLTLNVNDGYISLVSTGTSSLWFNQVFETLLTGTYTITVKVKAVNGEVRVEFSGNMMQLFNGLNTFTISGNNVASLSIVLGAGTSIDIEYIKLEQGSIATPFVPRPYGEELALCQRYEFKNPNGGAWIGYGYVNSAGTVAIISIPLPVNMRDIPTISYSSFTLYGSGTSLDISNAHVGGLFNNILQLQINNVSGFGKNAVVSARIDNFEANAEIY